MGLGNFNSKTLLVDGQSVVFVQKNQSALYFLVDAVYQKRRNPHAVNKVAVIGWSGAQSMIRTSSRSANDGAETDEATAVYTEFF